jgi:hypothetical protein
MINFNHEELLTMKNVKNYQHHIIWFYQDVAILYGTALFDYIISLQIGRSRAISAVAVTSVH